MTKRFGKTVAVDDLSFAVERGRITGFLGPNGAGKTTTLRVLLGLVHATEGTATILGRPYRSLDEPATKVGAVLEATGFHPTRSGRNHLRVLAAATGVSAARVDEVLALVKLEPWGRRKVKTYSLGMKQRLSLAGALLGDPDVFVLDEPANGLDPEGIRWLRDLLRALSEQGRTILISSHVLAEIAQTVDDVVIVQRGRMVAHAPLAELTTAAGAVRVRTPTAERLRDLLASTGVRATIVASDRLAVEGTPERVGEIAAANGVVLHELRADTSLEEVFLQLTGGRGDRIVTRLIYADLLRIRTTRTIAWYLAGLIIGVGLGVTGQMVTLSAEELEQEQIFLDTLEASGASTILMLIYGLIGFAGEHRHGTITQMFLATPVRERVVAAKVITFSFVGLLLGVFAIALTIAMALPWMAAKGAQADVFDRDAILLLLGIVATATLWGGLGAAFGAIAPNQVAAIVIVFAWFFVIENIISGLLPEIAPYTPGGAARGLMGADEENLLPMGAAAAVTAGYVLALSALGAALVLRRDVT